MLFRSINRYESDEDDNDKTVEEKIYGGLYSNEDKSILENFQLGTWEERLNLLSRFSDERLKKLGHRLLAFYAPELLTKKEQDAFQVYLKNKWFAEDEKTEWTTIKNVKKQLDILSTEGCDKDFFSELKNFYKKRLEEQNCIF